MIGRYSTCPKFLQNLSKTFIKPLSESKTHHFQNLVSTPLFFDAAIGGIVGMKIPVRM